MIENVFNSTFYATPGNFSSNSSKPGEILKFEKVSGSDLDKVYAYPPGLTLYRMLYVSKDLTQKPVPASAFILLPYTTKFTGTTEMRTVVWTHGTSGITRDCAPSVQRQLYYDFVGLYLIAMKGYAIIAPDYAGQGADTQFNYVSARSHAYDVASAVIASRTAFPKSLLTYDWAVIGHSEGGLSAWAVNEHQAVEPTGGFLGAVSVAPAMDPQSINQRQLGLPDLRAAMEAAGTVFYPVTFLESIRRLNTTAVNVSDWLTPKGEKVLEYILKGGCFAVGNALVAGSRIEDIFKSVAWVNASFTDAWTDNVQSRGVGALAGPMLVIQGDKDEAVDPYTNFKAYQANCAANKDSKIRYSIYPDMMHGPVVFAGFLEYTQFLWALFEKDPWVVPSTCESSYQNATIASPNLAINFATRFQARH
ncbi:alpha/beta-hydrolase [Gonapodya prolifera JEL478]|uniref:Alpha/beta-hydrolase n=1 Tax=Gonapodya prolifera (strain JEL478) TaxID=1344416 RepID=A0A139AC10_GONPJ|nr:alpha/beta-hydrolase [Gonapodya prolifera JEL478]|eukprot:KXS14341.1 alpha/beta-hydrolase [Gonapodya prolifera JEL478]